MKFIITTYQTRKLREKFGRSWHHQPNQKIITIFPISSVSGYHLSATWTDFYSNPFEESRSLFVVVTTDIQTVHIQMKPTHEVPKTVTSQNRTRMVLSIPTHNLITIYQTKKNVVDSRSTSQEITLETTPAPTVLPPSLKANLCPVIQLKDCCQSKLSNVVRKKLYK